MERILLPIALISFCAIVNAQGFTSLVTHGTGAPASCPIGVLYTDDLTGTVYVSKAGVCQTVSSGMVVAAVFAGSDDGAKIAAAVDSLPVAGGTVDARSLAGGTISGFTISKPTVLLMGNAAFTLAAGQTITVSSNFVIRGQRNATRITAAREKAIFTLTDSFASGASNVVLSDMTFSGNAQSGTHLLDATALGKHTFNESRLIVDNCVVSDFRGMAISVGQSFYYSSIGRSWFGNNTGGSILTGRYSDILIHDNTFFNPGDSPHITTYGSSTRIVGNGFIPAATSSGPDILITSALSGGDGFSWINKNKFGPELETASRYKIKVLGDSANNIIPAVHITDNEFFGVTGQTAIDLESPIQEWVFESNHFDSFATLIRDAQPPVSINSGLSVWGENNIITASPSNATATNLFTNGGRGFKSLRLPSTAKEFPFTDQPREVEARELRNRLFFSEGFGIDGTVTPNAWVRNGFVDADFTTGQPDPYGGTRAVKITRQGTPGSAAAFSNIRAPVDRTGWTSGRLILTFWARAETGTGTVAAGVYDSVTSAFSSLPSFNLSTTWKLYKVVASGLNTADGQVVIFYPFGTGSASGAIHLFGAQVSDYDSDYAPTTGTPFIDTTTGARYERKVIYANGLAAQGGLTVGSTASSAPLKGVLTGTYVWSPPSLANGMSASASINTPGALIGSPCVVGFSSITSKGWTVSCQVTDNDYPTVTVTNNTGHTVALPTGTLRSIVFQF